ncbi:enoyl-CoA hydratase/isomerase family protein, partial [Burkholderia sp. Ac-20392]|nr:enoyl-CoA hydratase/isomerase family protein [Burkholderia sp. Ac-20392]
MNSPASPTSPAGTVTRERRDKVLVVTIDHPPVNALSADVRRGLSDALDVAQADDERV